MSNSEKIFDQSDSLIGLLTAQCADLEQLLGLARQETAAAEQADFEEIMRIVTERDRIGHRLETFQQQISELRGVLGAHDAHRHHREITERTVEIANLTIAQDGQTRRLLTAARDDAALELQKTERSSRGTNAYLSSTRKGLAYNRDF